MKGTLWGYRSTTRTTTRDSLFSMAYGFEELIPVEAIVPTHRWDTYDPTANHTLLQESLDLNEELHEDSQLRVAAYQQKVARYFNARVKDRKFGVGDLVLQRVFLATRDPGAGILRPNWECPY